MTYATPDLNAISLQTNAVILAAMGRDPTLPRSVLGVLAKALSGAVDGLYGDIDAAAKDIIYDTASQAALIRWAGIWGLTLKVPTSATGTVTFTGGVGTVPAGAVMTRGDGVQYVLAAAVPLVAGVGSGTATCVSAGAMTNSAAGGILTLMQPTPGVTSTVTVGTGGLSGAADIETPAELLARLLVRIRQTPQGGSTGDFEDWALAVPGVTRVWVVPSWNGPGTIGILFMCDDRANPIPQAADVAAVAAAIAAQQPVVGAVYVVAPCPVPLNPAIHLTPDTATIRASVQANLASLIANTCAPISPQIPSGIPQTPVGFTLPLTQVEGAISSAAGVVDFIMSAPAANVTTTPGSITTMGAITWV